LATTVYSTEDIVLSNGIEVTLRPLPVKHLKKTLAKFGEYTKAISEAVEKNEAAGFDPDGTKLIDNLLACSTLALAGLKVEVPAEELEDVLDLETMYKILQVCADINLKDASANFQNQVQEVVGQN
jgi:hypothetical protein